MLPRGVIFSGSGAAMLAHEKPVPPTSDLDFFVFGETILERKTAFQEFSKLIYTVFPKTKTVTRRAITTFLVPDYLYKIQMIYTDCSTWNHILAKFDITLAKIGLINTGWVQFKSSEIAWKYGMFTADSEVKGYRIDKWQKKGFKCITETKDFGVEPDTKYHHYTIPLNDSDPGYTNHILKLLFDVTHVCETFDQVLEHAQYEHIHTGSYDTAKELILTSNVECMEMLMQKFKPIIDRQWGRRLRASFQVDIGQVKICHVFNTTYGKVNLAVELQSEVSLNFIRVFDLALSTHFGKNYTSFTSKGHMVTTVCQNELGNISKARFQQYLCTMRVSPRSTGESQIYWSMISARNLIPAFPNFPTLVVIDSPNQI